MAEVQDGQTVAKPFGLADDVRAEQDALALIAKLGQRGEDRFPSRTYLQVACRHCGAKGRAWVMDCNIQWDQIDW